MARKEISFIATDGRDAGKEFVITEMSAWDADTLAQDVFRAMGDADIKGISPDVIAMGCAGLATIGMSVISASSPEVARQLRDRLIDTVEIVITHDGKQNKRKVNGSIDFEEVSTIRTLLDKVFQANFDFLVTGEG